MKKTLDLRILNRMLSLKSKGFALVATISILALVVMLAMAMVSLAKVVSRQESYGQYIELARANARVALCEAIAKLQTELGPDQRITAESAILSETHITNPHWIGVWDSWKAGVGENSQHATLDDSDEMAPNYNIHKTDRFRGWMLSVNQKDLGQDKALNLSLPTRLSFQGGLQPSALENSVRLLGAGSLGENADSKRDFVSAPLRYIRNKDAGTDPTGRYAWWLRDESLKARVFADSFQDEVLTDAEKIHRKQAPASLGNSIIPSLNRVRNENDFNRAISLSTLDLIDLLPAQNTNSITNRISQENFFSITTYGKGILTDVREGGLKRDLSTILERPIDTADDGDEYLLYAFDDPRFPDRSNSRVPIQDLSAYYQMYENDPKQKKRRKKGVVYTSKHMAQAIHTESPDFGGTKKGKSKKRKEIQSAYTTLYTQPVVTKVQFVLGIGAQKVTPEERLAIQYRVNNPHTPGPRNREVPMRKSDTHKLLLGVLPVVTLWNPNNIPMVMDRGQIFRYAPPPFAMRWRKYRKGDPNIGDDNYEAEQDGVYDYRYFSMNYALGLEDSLSSGISKSTQPHLIQFHFAKGDDAIIFEPGEVKAFSPPLEHGMTLQSINQSQQKVADFRNTVIEPVNGYNPFGTFIVPQAAPLGEWRDGSPEVFDFEFPEKYVRLGSPVFKEGDFFTFEVVPESSSAKQHDGLRVTVRSEVLGTAFGYSMIDENHYKGDNFVDFLRHTQMISRHGGVLQHRSKQHPVEIAQAEFNRKLFEPAFAGNQTSIAFVPEQDKVQAISGKGLIDRIQDNSVKAILEFSFSYGCELGEQGLNGLSGGRRIASRPFLHAGLNAAPFFDRNDKPSLYNYGWDWKLDEISGEIEDSSIQVDAQGRGFFGGSYGAEGGQKYVIQREIPVMPIMSIASLSHAHMGGFSLARNNIIGDDPKRDNFDFKLSDRSLDNRMRVPIKTDFQKTTASGQGGLAPHVLQSIGNSYAHPNIPADKAFLYRERHFSSFDAPVAVPFVDHSYLANKALWDEYYFSSITPQIDSVKLYEGNFRTAEQVAKELFFEGGFLPNRKFVAYGPSLSKGTLENLFKQYDKYIDGFADKIAAYLMVRGQFNVNSTSKTAWKMLFSSLKGKPGFYLKNGDDKLSGTDSVIDGTVVSFANVGSSIPIKSSQINGSNVPFEQWMGGRELTDLEIDKLAEAMVRQVKLRGPFLAHSEFVNRRLDSSNENLSLKGAIQSAIDDPMVALNADFWDQTKQPSRLLDEETKGINFEFAAAAKGPIAYGSAAYIDQADLLRGLASKLNVRGDTFVIRAYGDHLDSNGVILAQAWCEAVIQRIPEYSEPSDAPHLKFSDLTSEKNKFLGRKFRMHSFRWLTADCV